MEDLARKLDSIIQKLQSDLATIRTGRASSSLVENLKVSAYGSTMALKELASISVPEPRQILISPWDKLVSSEVEKALRVAGFNPAVEEGALRIILPSLTGEEREKLVRAVGGHAEDAKVALRLARRKEIERIEDAEEKKEISEDEEFSQKKAVDQLLDNYNRKVEEFSQEKVGQLRI